MNGSHLIVLVIAAWLLFAFIRTIVRANRGERPPRPSSQQNHQPPSRPPRPDVYRPRATAPPNQRITFGTTTTNATNTGEPELELADLHDAFTGAALNKSLGLYQCSSCKVFYHTASMELLRAENNSRCVSCSSTAIVHITGNAAAKSRGRDFTPGAVTLANFAQHFGQVVTFEGTVVEVQTSRRGTDYAAMFERASWTKGLKLVFFRGSIRAAGGATFIRSLAGKSVRVRGLLIKHPIFGPEIIVTEREMILKVT